MVVSASLFLAIRCGAGGSLILISPVDLRAGSGEAEIEAMRALGGGIRGLKPCCRREAYGIGVAISESEGEYW